MKLHALELTGFGPFRETQRVDFDAFDRDGLFLISGRTGTGKSSILDGVSFALYGTVPRYEGGEKRLRSDHSFVTDPTEVRLEFTAGDTRWRVTRAPEYERPAKRGGGLTTEPARAELEELVGGVWVGRAAKPRTVGETLGEVLGLNAQQFQQVILLAQNKFSRFLLAPGDERQTLLRTLFGTRRFEDYREALEVRRREARATRDAATTRAETLVALAERLVDEHALGGEPDPDGADAETAPSLDERRGALVAAQMRADYHVEQGLTARTRADEAHTAAVARHAALAARYQRGREREAMRDALTTLEARVPEIAELRERVVLARAAQALRAPLDAFARAEADVTAAVEAERDALARWTDAGGETSADLAAHLERLAVDLARWEAAAAQERELDALHTRSAELAAAIGAASEELGALDARLAGIPAARAALDERLAAARDEAARQDDLRQRHDELAAQLAAAREVARLSERSAAAERAHQAAIDVDVAAALHVRRLLQRRLDGYAGELAADLAPGDPCAVCGSTTHPHLAPREPDSVTDEDVAAAERERERASSAATAAAEVARRLRDDLSAARARSGGKTEDVAEELLADVRHASEAADAAAVRRDALLAERTDLDAQQTRDEAARAETDVRRAADREARSALESDIARMAAAVAEARGDAASVAARVSDGEAERRRARDLADARALAQERTRTLATVRADLERELARSPFDGADAVRAAFLDAATIDELDAQAAGHAADLTATRQRLLELELELVDEGDEIDEAAVEAAVRTAVETDAARTDAIAAHRDAENTAERLRALAVDADGAAAAVAEVERDAASITRLADTVAGRAPNTMKMDLETFVLAAELEEIVTAANLHLSEMSAGRYSLHHSDARAARGRASGLGIDVLDAHTGRLRTPQSLSGGETFLASLALALGLGEVVTSRAGGIRLDTLFVDEGFGSLDPETLELAMRTLDALRAGGRTVGVISHVEAMKEQLPAQLVVEATPQGPSVIRQDAPAAP
ncbi:MAG: ATPase [Microbacterium sp. SCN 70-27]|uniref:AAA family ATPase n=1 Tax=unclassified Microbacterium TaxID=2609290 RepID=UPI00086E55A9|nr:MULTISPECIES: SMC family ATPase [unclassified Microbacterium]MBN9223910.1 SMC family ATPase [Microbacterium sp.]ODT27497.1 MAG: ATPase [Microbacterium sp. SCN 70-27]